jgi:hypothetical protein
MEKTNNGRVDIFNPPKSCNIFNLYDRIPAKQCATYLNATEGIWNDTTLSKAFFSRENIKIIQNAIRRGVYDKSNSQYVIGEQSCDDLKMIMRSIFLQHSKNIPYNIQEQIYELNKLVIAYCVDRIYSEALGYMQYIRDASTLVVPIDRPVFDKTNDKELILKDWF